MRVPSALVGLAVATLLAGCTSDPHEAKGSATVAVGGFKEINLHLDAGQSVEWSWSATGPLHFNVHSHIDGVVTEHVVQHTASHSGSFTAPTEGGYSLMWENRETRSVALDYDVTTEGNIE